VKAWWWVLALGHRVGPLAHSRGASAPRRGAGTPISPARWACPVARQCHG